MAAQKKRRTPTEVLAPFMKASPQIQEAVARDALQALRDEGYGIWGPLDEDAEQEWYE